MTPATRFELSSISARLQKEGVSLDEAEAEFRKAFIREVLMANGGNQCRGAAELKVHRNTLARNRQDLGVGSLRDIREGLKMRPGGVRVIKPVNDFVRKEVA